MDEPAIVTETSFPLTTKQFFISRSYSMQLKLQFASYACRKKVNTEQGFVKHLSYATGKDKVILLNNKSYMLLQIPMYYWELIPKWEYFEPLLMNHVTVPSQHSSAMLYWGDFPPRFLKIKLKQSYFRKDRQDSAEESGFYVIPNPPYYHQGSIQMC